MVLVAVCISPFFALTISAVWQPFILIHSFVGAQFLHLFERKKKCLTNNLLTGFPFVHFENMMAIETLHKIRRYLRVYYQYCA